ncbi:C39 family peptidase [Kitasatospora sp. NPDC093679]|uniref:glutamate ligase domain-containing protein n=1 Tax=Kitasatospora sp. NPDC093679 TaxID=3154983 RepID=UPI00342E11CF
MPESPQRHPIPIVTQYASPDLIAAFAYEGRPKGDDPNWADSGAPDREAYAHWAGRWCGMACLRMALFARDGHAPTLWELLQGALKFDAYQEREDGTVGGLFYRQFADYAAEVHQLPAEVITNLTPDRLRAELDAGHLVITSVHKEIRRPDRPAPGRGGHLVLVTGHHDGTVAFRNPSGHTPEAVTANLPEDVFDTFASHRGIALHIGAKATGSRLIAVLGEMRELGDDAVEGHRAVGQDAAEHGIDVLLAIGGDLAKQLALAAGAAGVPEVAICADNPTATAYLESILRLGDRVLVKGANSGQHWQIAQALTGQNITSH